MAVKVCGVFLCHRFDGMGCFCDMTYTIKPLNSVWEISALHLLTARAALPQINVEMLIGSQANYEIELK